MQHQTRIGWIWNFALVMGLSVLGGCAYAVPGTAANFHALGMTAAQKDDQTDPSIGRVLDRKPTATFPATVAVVRIQGNHYEPRTVQTYGEGMYSVVLTHDVEKPEVFDRLAALPMLRSLEPINRLELPEHLTSQQDLRAAAATVHADMLLIYTFDDRFDDRDNATALTILTFGILPTKYLTVTSTASAVLIDTRNGYIYGAAESSEKKGTVANCWGEDAAADSIRQQVEGAAFDKLVGDVQKTWTQVIREYAGPSTVPPTSAKTGM